MTCSRLRRLLIHLRWIRLGGVGGGRDRVALGRGRRKELSGRVRLRVGLIVARQAHTTATATAAGQAHEVVLVTTGCIVAGDWTHVVADGLRVGVVARRVVHFDDAGAHYRWRRRLADLFVDDFGRWCARTLDYALDQLLGLRSHYHSFHNVWLGRGRSLNDSLYDWRRRGRSDHISWHSDQRPFTVGSVFIVTYRADRRPRTASCQPLSVVGVFLAWLRRHSMSRSAAASRTGPTMLVVFTLNFVSHIIAFFVVFS